MSKPVLSGGLNFVLNIGDEVLMVAFNQAMNLALPADVEGWPVIIQKGLEKVRFEAGKIRASKNGYVALQVRIQRDFFIVTVQHPDMKSLMAMVMYMAAQENLDPDDLNRNLELILAAIPKGGKLEELEDLMIKHQAQLNVAGEQINAAIATYIKVFKGVDWMSVLDELKNASTAYVDLETETQE